MTGIVWSPIGSIGEALVVLDADRRLYAGLSRDGSYWHTVSPLQADVTDADGNVVRRTGQLGCICKGATFRGGTCYRVKEAEAFEGDLAFDANVGPDWLPRGLDNPAGAGESVEAARG